MTSINISANTTIHGIISRETEISCEIPQDHRTSFGPKHSISGKCNRSSRPIGIATLSMQSFSNTSTIIISALRLLPEINFMIGRGI